MTAVLLIDVETSDLLKKLPLDDPSQPWVVALAAILDVPGQRPQRLDLRIRAEGRHIRPGAEAVHGVTSRSAAKHGMKEAQAFGALMGLIDQAEVVVGHGIESFDRPAITSVLLRGGKPIHQWLLEKWQRPGLVWFDTMKLATLFCKIPKLLPPPKWIPGAFTEDGIGFYEEPVDYGEFKWPSLDEACEILLGKPPREGIHDPWTDLERTKRLWAWLQERNAAEAAA